MGQKGLGSVAILVETLIGKKVAWNKLILRITKVLNHQGKKQAH